MARLVMSARAFISPQRYPVMRLDAHSLLYSGAVVLYSVGAHPPEQCWRPNGSAQSAAPARGGTWWPGEVQSCVGQPRPTRRARALGGQGD